MAGALSNTSILDFSGKDSNSQGGHDFDLVLKHVRFEMKVEIFFVPFRTYSNTALAN